MTFFLLYFFLLYNLIIITYNTYNIITYRNIQLNYFNLKLGNWEALKPYLYCEVVCLFLPIYYALSLFTYWYYTSIDHKVVIIVVIVFALILNAFQVPYFYLLSYYDRKYLWLLSLCGITEKYWALEIQSYSSSSFWHTDFFHKSKWLGGVGIWALA